MFFRAWVLIGTDDPRLLPEAGELLERAWDLREEQDAKNQANIARQAGLLNIKRQQFTQAYDWLQRSDQIIQQAVLDERKRLECLSYTRYYQGWAYFDAGEIETAKPYFEEAHQYAEAINIDRFVQVIETSLADVAIHQGDLTLAKALLDKGLQIAEAKADRRRIASIKHSFAKLAQAEGNPAKQRRDAAESLQIFAQLGMITESKAVQALITSDLTTAVQSKPRQR
jgi:tetratricopeptide (TPR) repeat protein